MQQTVSFLDLSREIQPIQEEIQTAMHNIIFKQTNFILGSDLELFENNFASYITAKYCIGVGNGTDAVEMAVQALQLQPNDEIITQANTYVATCFGVTNNNLTLKLVDNDADTYQMNLDELEKRITEKTKAVIVVHLTGSCCDMTKLMEIIRRHHLVLIEDCAQSHGATFNGKRLGSFGVLSTHSFYPGKNLGAFGDGGSICTSDQNMNTMLRKMRNNGSIEKYRHDIMGRNSRLDTLQAAILDIKLTKLNDNNAKRRNNAQLYCELLKNTREVMLPKIIKGCEPVYHLFMIRVEKRDELKKYLTDHEIGNGIHYPICVAHLECYSNYFDVKEIDACVNAKANSECILSLPTFPDLTEAEIRQVCKCIIDFYIMEFPF